MKTSGFSLLEVLVAWAILNIALLSIVEILIVETKQTQKIVQSSLMKLQVRETRV